MLPHGAVGAIESCFGTLPTFAETRRVVTVEPAQKHNRMEGSAPLRPWLVDPFWESPGWAA
jgi:hypothetical protein